MWTVLCFAATAIAFIFAAGVPIFSYLIGISASLFASWYTYGIAGFFWLYDAYYLGQGWATLKKKWIGASLAVFTIAAGGFMCIAGTYVSVKVSAFSLHPTLTMSDTWEIANCKCVLEWYCRKAIHMLGEFCTV